MKVVLTRHGETQGTLERRYCGAQSDTPLCEQGKRALRAYKQYVEVGHVYTTGLLRTEQTADICYPNATHSIVGALQEMNFGEFEGKNWQELREVPSYQAWVDNDCLTQCPGGESRAEFIARCCAAFERIMKTEKERGARKVHFVVHGGTIMALASVFGQPPRGYFEAQTVPGECWECRWDGVFLQVLSTKRLEQS